jgi:hypothetical protein
MWRRLRNVAALGPRGWKDLWRAQTALLRAQRRLRDEPIGSLAIREPFGAADASGDPGRAYALAMAVHRASRFGLIRPYCLVRAMALRDLLVEDRILGASIRIGVRRANGEFQAHAWVRWGDRIVGDDPGHVAGFTEVDDLGVMSRA